MTYFGYLMAVVIQMLNAIIGMVIGKGGAYAGFSTHTREINFRSQKQSMGKFLNAGAMTFCIKVFIPLFTAYQVANATL